MARRLAGARIGVHATPGAIAFVLIALALGCGSHHVAANGTRSVTKTVSTVSHNPSSAAHKKSPTLGGPFTGTCPKEIAATCVPGQKFQGSVVCVGHGKRTARTPTQQDLVRLRKGAAKANKEFRRTGKLPKGPTELHLRRLPNGKVIGTCEWGNTRPVTLPVNADNY